LDLASGVLILTKIFSPFKTVRFCADVPFARHGQRLIPRNGRLLGRLLKIEQMVPNLPEDFHENLKTVDRTS